MGIQSRVAGTYAFIVNIGLASQGFRQIVVDIGPDYSDNEFRELILRLKLKKFRERKRRGVIINKNLRRIKMWIIFIKES